MPNQYLGQRNCARLVISPSGDHLGNESPTVVTTASPCRIRHVELVARRAMQGRLRRGVNADRWGLAPFSRKLVRAATGLPQAASAAGLSGFGSSHGSIASLAAASIAHGM